MTDAQNTQQRSPLDVLEDILKDQGQEASSEQATSPVDPEAEAQAQEAAKLAEIKALEAQKLAQDQQELVLKQAELETAKQTPAYQARVEQQNHEQQQAATQQAAQAGHEIKQVTHTKIEEIAA